MISKEIIKKLSIMIRILMMAFALVAVVKTMNYLSTEKLENSSFIKMFLGLPEGAPAPAKQEFRSANVKFVPAKVQSDETDGNDKKD